MLEEAAGALAGEEFVDPADVDPDDVDPDDVDPADVDPADDGPVSLLLELDESEEEDGVVEEDAPRLSFL